MGKYDKIKLDRERPFGDTRPPVTAPESLGIDQVAHHCQDKLYFDQDGNLCEWMLSPKMQAELEARLAAEEAAEIGARAAREAMEKLGFDPDAVDFKAIPRKLAPNQSAISESAESIITAFMENSYRGAWSKVREAFKKVHGYAPPNKEAAQKFLRERGTGFGRGSDEIATAEALKAQAEA